MASAFSKNNLFYWKYVARGLFNYFKNFIGAQDYEIERVLLGLSIVLPFCE